MRLGQARGHTRRVDNLRRIRSAGLGAGMLAATLLAGLLLRDVTPPADAWLVDHALAAPGSRLAAVATAISGVGTLLCLAALTAGAVAAAVVRRRGGRGAGYVARVLVTVPAAASVLLLQGLFLRPGPPQQPQVGTYPSGHVAVVTAIAFAAVLLCRELGRGWHRAALAGALTAVTLVAGSRIVLAEHWLLDAAGAVAGALGVGLLVAAALRLGPATPVPVRSAG
jgi:membrane-associated phospholipid phosphatase